MIDYTAEILERKFLQYLDDLNDDSSERENLKIIGKAQNYFINYGLQNIDYAGHCLDLADMMGDLVNSEDYVEVVMDKNIRRLFGVDSLDNKK